MRRKVSRRSQDDADCREGRWTSLFRAVLSVLHELAGTARLDQLAGVGGGAYPGENMADAVAKVGGKMKNPKRYLFYIHGDHGCSLKIAENGNYVKYEDYQRLLKEYTKELKLHKALIVELVFAVLLFSWCALRLF